MAHYAATGVALLTALAITFASLCAYASTDSDLTRSVPPPVVTQGDNATLADAASFFFRLNLAPDLVLGNTGIARPVAADPMEDTSLWRATGSISSAGYAVHEATTWGYTLHIDAATVAFAWQGTAAPAAAGGIALSVDSAAAQWRRYFPVAALDTTRWPLFGVLEGGVHDATIALRRQSTADATPWAVPVSVAVGGGIGRLLPIAPRIALARIEQVLVEAGVTAGCFPEAVREAVLRAWVAHSKALGYAQQALVILQTLADAGLLRDAVTVTSMYQVERIVAALTLGADLPRWHGSDTRWVVRLSHTLTAGGAGAAADGPTWAIELRSRHVLNLSLDADIWLEAAAAWAPQWADGSGNTLAGNPHVTLMSAAGTTVAAVPGGTWVLDLPLHYTRIIHDAYYNTAGLLALHGSATLGFGGGPQAGVSLGGAYTFLLSGVRGVALGLHAGVGYVGHAWQETAQLSVAYVDGTGSSYYVSPDRVGDTLPINASWLTP